MTQVNESWFADLERCIRDFEIGAFETPHITARERKKRMRFASQSTPDFNIAEILGRSISDLALHPERVRRAIHLSRGHIETLRSLKMHSAQR